MAVKTSLSYFRMDFDIGTTLYITLIHTIRSASCLCLQVTWTKGEESVLLSRVLEGLYNKEAGEEY